MAADNYSDVVKALAQQIVGTCVKLIGNRAPGLIASADIDASQITGDTSIFMGNGGTVTVDGVIGLNQAIANAISNSSINVDQIVQFDENVGLVVKDIKIDTAQINQLQAYVADIAKAEIGEADIDTAQIRDLSAEVARIADAEIQSATIDTANIDWANINWANIKNSITGNAIITQGVSGKLYVTDLAVTDANIVSLSVGELLVKGHDDGLFYAVTVDGKGNVTATRKEVVTDEIANLSITNDKIDDETINGDAKMIGGSITARTLNVKDIFADSAIIRELIAANIDVDTLFAREATIAKINTMDISGNQSLRIGVENYITGEGAQKVSDIAQSAVIAMDDDSIAAKVMNSEQFTGNYSTTDQVNELIDDITVGSRNYIRRSKDLIMNGIHMLKIIENINLVGNAKVGLSTVG